MHATALVILGLLGGMQSTTAAHKPSSTVVLDVPSVLLGDASLTCNIDWKTNGVQRLKLNKGGGIEFDAEVSPIVDGTVTFGKDGSARYRFTSHLAKPAKGSMSGVGDVEFESLETKVSVDVTRFDQPGGAGTPFSFTSADISDRGVYVEFSGIAKGRGGERHAFRVNLGPVTKGSGKVEPADANISTKLRQKKVLVDAPTTTVLRILSSGK
jgi:hypothetical protein